MTKKLSDSVARYMDAELAYVVRGGGGRSEARDAAYRAMSPTELAEAAEYIKEHYVDSGKGKWVRFAHAPDGRIYDVEE